MSSGPTSGGLRELVPGQIWFVDEDASKFGFHFGARMTVMRLEDGTLALHSPVGVDHALSDAIGRLGKVSTILCPTRFHTTYLKRSARTFRSARMYAPPNFATSWLGVDFSGNLADDRVWPWSGIVQQVALKGSRLYDEVVFYHEPARTLVLADLLFNIPRNRGAFTSFVAASLGVLGKPHLSRSFGLTLKDRSAMRDSLRRILDWDFDRIILSHGDVVEHDGRSIFESAVSPWLG